MLSNILYFSHLSINYFVTAVNFLSDHEIAQYSESDIRESYYTLLIPFHARAIHGVNNNETTLKFVLS